MCVQMYPGWSARDNYAVHKKRRKRKIKQGGGGAGDAKTEPADDNGESTTLPVGVVLSVVFCFLFLQSGYVLLWMCECCFCGCGLHGSDYIQGRRMLVQWCQCLTI